MIRRQIFENQENSHKFPDLNFSGSIHLHQFSVLKADFRVLIEKEKRKSVEAQAGVCVNNEISFRIYGVWQRRTYFPLAFVSSNDEIFLYWFQQHFEALRRVSFFLHQLTTVSGKIFLPSSGFYFSKPFFIPFKNRFSSLFLHFLLRFTFP